MGEDADSYRDVDEIEQRAAQTAEAETDLAEVLADMQERLEVLEAHFSTRGLNELARLMEQRIAARIGYQINPESESE